MVVKKETARNGWRELGGLLLAGFGILLMFCLFTYDPADVSAVRAPPNAPSNTWGGPAGAWLAYTLFMSIGLATYALPFGVLAYALMLLFQREGRVSLKGLWLVLILLVFSCLIELPEGLAETTVQRLNLPSAGGLLGYEIGRLVLARYIGAGGTWILGCTLLLVGLVFFFDIHLPTVGRWIAARAVALWTRYLEWRKSRMDRRELLEYEEKQVEKQRRHLEKTIRSKSRGEAAEPEGLVFPASAAGHKPADAESPAAGRTAPPRAEKPERAAPRPPPREESQPLPRPDFTRTPAPEAPPEPPRPARPKPAGRPREPEVVAAAPAGMPSVYQLPPASLLANTGPLHRELQDDLDEGGRILLETLSDFGIEAELRGVETGPVVTRYEVKPAAGVRVERVVNLSNNIALSMRAESVRVQAPIPGKDAVGIEVPNTRRNMVCLRDVLESETWRVNRAALPLAIGKDVGGRVIVADLTEMPHMLIAGATGSGKTVCMNSLLAGLLMTRTPEEMRLMLVDPKIVEFSAYRELPHLVVPVITDAKKVQLGLRWCINEMELRYKMFARVGVRNIKAFNSRPPAPKQQELFGDLPEDGGAEEEDTEPAIPDRVPYIIVVVDELADLMLVARAEIENQIARLAQLSRAVGIHLILATQRPSVNVITGTIKANFPARIAFQVAQKVDSRTILDAIGADKLLGKGDMLFLPPGTGKLVRAQGCLSTDQEVHAIADFWRMQGEPNYVMAIKEKLDQKGGGGELPDMEEDDGLIEQAVEIIRQTRRASTSMLQRRLRIGYTRAARIVDLLEERGIVGPAQGSDPREILIDLDGEIPQNEAQPSAPEEEPDDGGR